MSDSQDPSKSNKTKEQSKIERIKDDPVLELSDFDLEPPIDKDNESDEEKNNTSNQSPMYDCSRRDTEVSRDGCNWADSGEFEDQPLCGRCYGRLLMDGEV